jgi:hypothetical protein
MPRMQKQVQEDPRQQRTPNSRIEGVIVYTSEGAKMRSIENQLAEQQKQSWLMLVAGITAGFIGLHFMMARPLVRQIAQMQQNMAQVEQRMQDLVGARDTVWEANSLLSSLKAQQGQISDARGALQNIRELRSDLIEEASHNSSDKFIGTRREIAVTTDRSAARRGSGRRIIRANEVFAKPSGGSG